VCSEELLGFEGNFKVSDQLGEGWSEISSKVKADVLTRSQAGLLQ